MARGQDGLRHHSLGIAGTLLLFLALCLTQCLAKDGVIVIRQKPEGVADTQLLDALQQQSVTQIFLASDYAVGTQFDNYSRPFEEGSPIISIDRNVTVSGLPGVVPTPMLDFQFKLSVAQLCNDCWFTFRDVNVKDERMGANGQFDFFVGEGSSVIFADNVTRNRVSCTDPPQAAKLVERTQRSPRFLGPEGMKQMYSEGNLNFRGQLFPSTLHLLNYSAEFPKHYNGGYTVVLRNVWRLCHHYVGPSCLLKNDADICVFQDIQRILAGQQQEQQESRGLPKGILAAIVSAGVAVALLAAAAALLCYRGRRKRQYARPSPTDKLVLKPSGTATETPDTCPQPCDQTGPHDSKDRPEGSGIFHSSPDCDGGGGGGGVGGGGGSECISSHDNISLTGSSQQATALRRAACMQPLPGSTASLNSTILCNMLTDLHFGHVLGTGSFGRVYKARLGECDVAVKVIEHDSRMSPAVANEVSLMMSCKHPNVVAAFHFVTHTHKQDTVMGSESFTRGLGSSRLDAPGSADNTCSHEASAQTAGRGSVEPATTSRGSGNSVDRPIPVLPVAKLARKPCPVCDVEVMPASPARLAVDGPLSLMRSGGDLAAPGSSNSANGSTTPIGSTSSSRSPSRRCSPSLPAPVCSCSCGKQQEARSLLLNCQESGGFWPAGPSALLEQAETVREPEENMVTTWLIQEYCDAGTLSKQASMWLPALEDEKQMIKRLLLLHDVVKGLRYLHSKCIVHGDLNARNVLVTTRAASACGLTAKLADLGLSRTIKQHNTHHTTCTVGTMSHMPPELLRHGHMSCAVDVYAFGVMMWEVYTSEVAFRELHYGQFFETVVLRDQRPPVPPGMPEDYKVLMEHCWAADPAERPSTKAISECIGLMIADRQHSLGLPVSSSVGAVDREFGRQHGSSDSSGHMLMMQQLSAQYQQQQQQQASAPQQQVQHLFETQHQQQQQLPVQHTEQQQPRDAWQQGEAHQPPPLSLRVQVQKQLPLLQHQEQQRKPTPARAPPHAHHHHQPLSPSQLSPRFAAKAQLQHLSRDAQARLQHGSRSLQSSAHDSGCAAMSSSSTGTSSILGAHTSASVHTEATRVYSVPVGAAEGELRGQGAFGQGGGASGFDSPASLTPMTPSRFIRDL